MGKNKKEKKANGYVDVARAKRKEDEKVARKHAKWKKTIIGCVCVLAAAALVVGGIFWVQGALKKDNTTESGKSDSAGSVVSGDLHETIGASSEHYQLNNALMTYYYVMLEDSFYASGSDYLNYMGVDTSLSLREQSYSGQTWFDILMSSVQTNVTQMLTLVEAADAAGMKLDEDELAQVEQEVKDTDLSHFDASMTEDDVRQAIQLSRLATKYSTQIQEETKTSESDWDTYYEENQVEYRYWQQLSYTFSFAADASGAATMTEADAKSWADELSKMTSQADFIAWVKDYATKNGSTAEEAETAANGCASQGSAEECGDEVAEWAMDAAVGSSYVATTSSSTTVYLLLSTPQRDETATIDVRHILVMGDNYDTDEAAKAEADRIYALWKENPTEENFAALAKEHSEDPGSAEDGGLYSGVYAGEMTQAFNDWCFDGSRAVGDNGIVQTEYGYHIMYFVKQGMPKWQADVQTAMNNEAYKTVYTGLEEKYPVTVNSEVLSQIAPEH